MISIIPCAGTATRIHGIPKYLLPVADGYLLNTLIQRMQAVDAQPIIGVNPENAGLVMQYKRTAFVHTAKDYKTMSETVLSCRNFADNETVLFGMPDTYIEDDDCFRKLIAAIDDGAHVAVALFHDRPGQHLKVGMCEIRDGRVVALEDKPKHTRMTWLWGALAWKPIFWPYMRASDPHVGYALPRAIAAGLDVRAVKMDGLYYDCGTFAEYEELIVHLHGRKEPVEMSQIYG